MAPQVQNYEYLFRSARIRSLLFKNRIWKAPQTTTLAHPDGSVTGALLDHYRRVAEGGVALVGVEAAYIDDEFAKASPCSLGIASSDHIPGLARLVDEIHAHGAHASVQLFHAGGQRYFGSRAKVPSVPQDSAETGKGELRLEPLTVGEIDTVVAAFGDAAGRATTAGFDMVEIAAGHGYLIHQFLSPVTNMRSDEYGGSLANRSRFLQEIIESVRAQIPGKCLVCVRVNAGITPESYDIDEAIDVCRLLEKCGVDVIHVSRGSTFYQTDPALLPEPLEPHAAFRIREAIAIPVVAGGMFGIPESAEDVLAKGLADFVSIGRALLADPFFPAKVQTGREADVRPCIRANECFERGQLSQRAILCTVNPTLGHEGKLEIPAATKARRVDVIGGGPAGLHAAQLLAAKGHSVTLREPLELGGLLRLAAEPEFKSDQRRLLEYLLRQVERGNVTIVGEEATLETVADGEVVVIATGARQRPLDLQGDDAGNVLDVVRAFGEVPTRRPGTKVVLIGGKQTGIQTALHFANAGAKVTVVEESDAILLDDGMSARLAYGRKLEEREVQTMTGATVAAIKKGAVTIRRQDREEELAADLVVNATGWSAYDPLGEVLRARGTEVYTIGSAATPGSIREAMHSAHSVALRV